MAYTPEEIERYQRERKRLRDRRLGAPYVPVRHPGTESLARQASLAGAERQIAAANYVPPPPVSLDAAAASVPPRSAAAPAAPVQPPLSAAVAGVYRNQTLHPNLRPEDPYDAWAQSQMNPYDAFINQLRQVGFGDQSSAINSIAATRRNAIDADYNVGVDTLGRNRDQAAADILGAYQDFGTNTGRYYDDYGTQAGMLADDLAQRLAASQERIQASGDPILADLEAQGLDTSALAAQIQAQQSDMDVMMRAQDQYLANQQAAQTTAAANTAASGELMKSEADSLLANNYSQMLGQLQAERIRQMAEVDARTQEMAMQNSSQAAQFAARQNEQIAQAMMDRERAGSREAYEAFLRGEQDYAFDQQARQLEMDALISEANRIIPVKDLSSGKYSQKVVGYLTEVGRDRDLAAAAITAEYNDPLNADRSIMSRQEFEQYLNELLGTPISKRSTSSAEAPPSSGGGKPWYDGMFFEGLF